MKLGPVQTCANSPDTVPGNEENSMCGISFFDLLPGEHKTVLLDGKQLEKGKDVLPILQVEASNAAAVTPAVQ
jgi:hypothetical protein